MALTIYHVSLVRPHPSPLNSHLSFLTSPLTPHPTPRREERREEVLWDPRAVGKPPSGRAKAPPPRAR